MSRAEIAENVDEYPLLTETYDISDDYCPSHSAYHATRRR